MTHATTNPYAELARQKKANKIADCAIAHDLPLALLEEAGPEFWATCAEQAGCNKPSAETIDLVLSIVRSRTTALSTASDSPSRERRPAPATASTAAPSFPVTPSAEGRPAVDVFDELEAQYRSEGHRV